MDARSHPRRPRIISIVSLLSRILHAPGFLYGYDIGATSFVLHLLLQPDTHHHESALPAPLWWDDFVHQPVLQGLLVGSVSAGALLGSHVVLFHLAAWISRRSELRVAALLYMLGSFLNVLSGTLCRFQVFGAYLLVLGRLVFGLGVGFVMHGAPTYMAEMAPSSIRGAVVSAKETVIVTGIVVGYFVGNLTLDWTHLYLYSGLVSLPFLLLTLCIPRSKRWLLMHGRVDEAKHAMQFVYKGDVTAEFELLAVHLLPGENAPQADSAASAPHIRLCAPQLRPSLVAALGLIVLQQLSGQPSVLSYVTVLLASAGWNGSASVVTSLLMAAASTATVLLVDRFGRTRLLSVSCLVVGLSALLLAVSYYGNASSTSLKDEWGAWQQSIVLVAVFAYIGGYQLGFGPITWLIVSEVFPQDVRGIATALGVELNYLLNFAVQFLIPLMVTRLGWGTTFLLFAASMAGGWVFVQTFIPETTGLSLEEIHQRHSTDASDLNDQRHGGDIGAALTETSPLL